MYNNLFLNIPFERQKTKPREAGITLIIDRKLGLKAQEDFLDLTGDYVDIAKMMVGISALINA
jgi:phosphosulfolactate synthase (CoM biosynthesis protein A)